MIGFHFKNTNNIVSYINERHIFKTFVGLGTTISLISILNQLKTVMSKIPRHCAKMRWNVSTYFVRNQNILKIIIRRQT